MRTTAARSPDKLLSPSFWEPSSSLSPTKPPLASHNCESGKTATPSSSGSNDSCWVVVGLLGVVVHLTALPAVDSVGRFPSRFLPNPLQVVPTCLRALLEMARAGGASSLENTVDLHISHSHPLSLTADQYKAYLQDLVEDMAF